MDHQLVEVRQLPAVSIYLPVMRIPAQNSLLTRHMFLDHKGSEASHLLSRSTQIPVFFDFLSRLVEQMGRENRDRGQHQFGGSVNFGELDADLSLTGHLNLQGFSGNLKAAR